MISITRGRNSHPVAILAHRSAADIDAAVSQPIPDNAICQRDMPRLVGNFVLYQMTH